MVLVPSLLSLLALPVVVLSPLAPLALRPLVLPAVVLSPLRLLRPRVLSPPALVPARAAPLTSTARTRHLT